MLNCSGLFSRCGCLSGDKLPRLFMLEADLSRPGAEGLGWDASGLRRVQPQFSHFFLESVPVDSQIGGRGAFHVIVAL